MYIRSLRQVDTQTTLVSYFGKYMILHYFVIHDMTSTRKLKSFLCHLLLQYDFPKKEAVIQFVIDAIQAESFNPKTLFLIGSYTIGRFSFSRT